MFSSHLPCGLHSWDMPDTSWWLHFKSNFVYFLEKFFRMGQWMHLGFFWPRSRNISCVLGNVYGKNNITQFMLLHFFKLYKNQHNSSSTQDMQHAQCVSEAPGQHVKQSQSAGLMFPGVSASTSVFLCQCHSSNAPKSFVQRSSAMYNWQHC
jgi:hypothetical protein